MRRALTAVLTVGAVTVAGCSGGGPHGSSGSGGAASTPAKRWWSNSAASAGSTIDPAHPKAAADKLHPSDSQYCGMLSDTLKARKSILPGATADDPALLQATIAFVAEIQKTAPSAVRGPWDTLAPVIIGLAKAGGVPSAMPSVNTGEVTQAATAIATDAKTRCGLDLSRVTAGPTH